MKEHEHILRVADRGKLPERIDGASRLSVSVVQELVEAGYLKAIDASSHDGVAYLDPKITLAGREYLAQLRERHEDKEIKAEGRKGRPTALRMPISGGPEAWLEIEREYDVSKPTLGKKISFVKDEFKRTVIFRDIEQAFLLAQYGFHKPSVILAGGVIEELLRLYLAHKNFRPEGNSLDSYIKACEEHGLIKDAIHKLADSVRQFRNIVHLEREGSRKHTISKATAKGAVSSVFTIANELGT
jgi:hypothetical protein